MVTLAKLVKLIEGKRTELAELETAARILMQLNGHVERKLQAMDRAVIKGHATLSPTPSKKRRKKPKFAVYDADINFEIPTELREKWTHSEKHNRSRHQPIALAVIHHLRAQKAPTDWPTVATVMTQLGWKTLPQVSAQLIRWKSATLKKNQFVLTRLGEKRVADAEQSL